MPTWSSVAGAAAAAGGVLYALNYLSNAPVPKKKLEARTKLVTDQFMKDMGNLYTFDQLIAGFEIEEARSDGFVRGTIVAKGPMISKSGKLHEGGLMCLVDDMLSLPVWIKAKWPGVSVGMSFTAVEPVAAGEKLTAEAKVVRIGSTLAFTSMEIRRTGSNDLVAVAEQTKHIGLPFLGRVHGGLANMFLGYAERLIAKGQEKRDKAIHGLVAKGKMPALKKIGLDKSMEEVLDLKPTEDPKEFHTVMKLSLCNGYLGGHGAASASLFAAAVREYLHQAGVQPVHITEMRCLYQTPVPALKPASVVLNPLPVSSVCTSRHFEVDLRNDKGQKFVRGYVTAVPVSDDK